MNRATLLYIPLALLFVFAAAAFYSHFSEMPQRYAYVNYDYRIGFVSDGSVRFAGKDAEAAGLKVGDRILSVNGVETSTSQAYQQQIDEAGRSGVMNLRISRPDSGAESEVREITVPMEPLQKDLNFYLRLIVGLIFVYVFPLACVLLGFWVVLVRPGDYLAWLLLFLLAGIGSIGLESFSPSSALGAFKAIFGGSWALSMFLFGLYFPERFFLDRKHPWLKWILIVPLAYQVLIVLLGQLKQVTGFGLVDVWAPISSVYLRFAFPLNMVSIGLFFAILGWKSGTLESPDSRRRLKMMVIGTCVATTPAFLIVLYTFISGARGSFYDVAPSWLALLALLLLLLFPLTMAYVIVVQQAMDVKVVVRQGIQYGLAKGGVRVLQFFLLLVVGLGVRWSINNYGSSFGTQFAIIVGGIALVPLIEFIAKPLRVWIDRKFFRDAYNSEQILLELSEDVRTMVETRPLLETVSAKISESLHVPQVALLVKNGAGYEPAYSLGYDTPPRSVLGDNTRAVQTLKRNQHILIRDVNVETTSTPTIMPDERKQIEDLNSQILLPLAVKDHLSGVLSLSAKRSEEPFTPSDLRLLKSVAAQTGLALENSRLTETIASEAAQKERLNREVEIAREVQERLFPQEFPNVDGLEYYGHCRPALGVGGDYYDFLELADGKFGFAIGDVSGKGIGAALMMASLQASLRGQAIHSGDDLSSLMANVNRLVYEASTTNRYATFFYAQYEASSRVLTYVNAGHNPPYLLRKGKDAPVLLTEGGPVVGMLPPILVNYSQGEIELKQGDLIVGFTDGISEAMNSKEEEWGEDALLAKLKTILDYTPTEIHDDCVAAADRFAAGAKQHDDMTMIVVRVL